MWKIVLAAAAAASLAPASPAFATSTGPAPAPRPSAVARAQTDLTLSYMADAGYAAAVRLTCTTGDAHPNAAKVCAALRKVDGNPGRITPAQTMCTMEYSPVTATASGIWRGKKVAWSAKFGNPCLMRQATGVLFVF
ncbi:SSI family serine proteinase inhibitor [Actinoplanes sp. NPDC051633]|uniref:SSI family serine proteinase inhibitor n=1 Tax=Actinoplanes sp. NPDC051633 TaxID=3155670 RepID=UPI003449ECE3